MNTYSFDAIDLITRCDRHDHGSLIDARQCWRDEQVSALRERLADARGESSYCNDNDCSCHKQPSLIEEQLGYFEALAAI